MSKNIYNFLFKFLSFALISSGSIKAAELRWAADTESGAPYVFMDPQNPTQMTGYEYDLVMALAQKLQMQPRFVQNAWEGLILGLERGEYDIAINGIEITDERKKSVLFSDPYYATFLQIVVRQNEERFKKLSDLVGYKVGTIAGALSENVLRAENGIEVVPYESEANAHQDLLLNRSDALLFDVPIVKYYSEVNSKFKVLPQSISAMTYGIAISKKNAELHVKINKALQEMIESGELKNIFERWALWNPATAQLFNDFSPTRIRPVEYEKYKNGLSENRGFEEKLSIYKKAMPLLLKAAFKTIQISFLAMMFAVGFGLILVTLRMYGGKFFSFLTISFIELIRGTPLLLQLFFIFYALPNLGLQLSPMVAAVLGLGINYAVQECEIYRGGLLSVHKNQIEAAIVLGFNRWQIFWSIQVPQAFRISLPPMTSDFIALIKDSSLVSVITMVELTKTYSTMAATYYDYIGFAIITALIYLFIGMPLVFLSRRLEKRFTFS